MSTIDIEAPGADEAALKTAIQALVPISKTTIPSPVNYVDIDLPIGYSDFEVVYTIEAGWDIGLVLVFSQDAGATWLTDYGGDGLAYRENFLKATNGVAGASGTSSDYGMAVLGGESGSVQHGRVMVAPGAASIPAKLYGHVIAESTDELTKYLRSYMAVCSLNTARINAVRFMTTNNGDPDNISPIDSFTGGTIALYGVGV